MLKPFPIIILALACTAAQARNVGHGYGGQAVGASSSGSQGGRYTLGDQFQPWPQDEMQQYAKPRFEPYRGDDRQRAGDKS